MRHYYSLNDYCRTRFGEKLYKLALDGGFTCPNRDGTVGFGGCAFCNGRGSGDFSFPVSGGTAEAIDKAKLLIAGKSSCSRYIAYFQNFSGTYASADRLREIYLPVITRDDIAVLDIATRPDCLGDEVLSVLEELNGIKPVWIELGLQTVHEDSAKRIHRGYPLEVYDSAVSALNSIGIDVIAHMIIGLPGETPEMIRQTAEYIGRSGAAGIKFHLLQVLSGTAIEKDYRDGLFSLPSLDEYIQLLADCITLIPPEMTVHRLTGDGAKKELIAPLWCGDKKHVLNEINRAFDAMGVIQGSSFL